MLVAILALVFVHFQATGVLTFNYADLLHTPMSGRTEFWIMLGFFLAFAVKLPAVPLHSWLPDAHSQAPTAGSVVLAGVLLKTAAFGLLRLLLPLFPHAAAEFAPVAMGLGSARHPLRRDQRLRTERRQASGGLHLDQPHGGSSWSASLPARRRRCRAW